MLVRMVGYLKKKVYDDLIAVDTDGFISVTVTQTEAKFIDV